MFELTPKETQEVEQLLWALNKPIKAQHLNEWKCVAAARGAGTDTRN